MALDMTIVAYKLKFIVSQFSILTTLAMPPKAGSVKWFNEAQGRGFITPNDGGPDVFVRHTSVADRGPGRGALREGDDVLFEVTDSPRGPVATSVVKK
ncbi:hypothetical protein RhiTH_001142 [Rhizoctonia solani]